jgi:F-type H+-transporting ATPase subunit alpha
MSDNRHFDQLVAAGKPVGEVIAVDRFLIKVKGLQPVNTHALVLFEDGSKGYVHHIYEDYVIILHLGNKTVSVGSTAVVQHNELVAKVGNDFIGRVVSVTGEPLDGKGPIAADAVWPVFSPAPPLFAREALDRQLETGVTVIDTLFPLMRGQRMALLGDGKSGKSTLATQIALNQVNTDIVSVYVLIAKRRSDVDMLLTRLNSYNAMQKSVVIVSTMADSLVLSYLAPYVACSMAEYFWQKCDQDTLLIYDDLTSHAHAYREIALLSGMSPGRDSFPGDMFYVHSSLLERAGKLASNHKTLTTVPMVFAAGGDITSYLPTNIMSITDGQWILDMKIFRDTMRPAVSVGLSVSRVGGRGQSDRQKKLGGQMFKTLTSFAEAQEFARFGSELSAESQQSLTRGNLLYKLLNQAPGESHSLMAQTLMLDIALNLDANQSINLDGMKKTAAEHAQRVKADSDFEKVRDELKQKNVMAPAKTPEPEKKPEAPAPAPEAKKEDKK